MSIKPSKNQYYCIEAKRRKMRFETQKEADLFIQYNAKDIEEENGKAPVRSYYCEFCCSWHVTSNPNALDCEIKAQRQMAMAEVINIINQEKQTKIKTLYLEIFERLKSNIEKAKNYFNTQQKSLLAQTIIQIDSVWNIIKENALIAIPVTKKQPVKAEEKSIEEKIENLFNNPSYLAELTKKDLNDMFSGLGKKIRADLKTGYTTETAGLIEKLEKIVNTAYENDNYNFKKTSKPWLDNIADFKYKLDVANGLIPPQKESGEKEQEITEPAITEKPIDYSKELVKAYNKEIKKIKKNFDKEILADKIRNLEQLLLEDEKRQITDSKTLHTITANLNKLKFEKFGCIISFSQCENPLLEIRKLKYKNRTDILDEEILKIKQAIQDNNRTTADDYLEILSLDISNAANLFYTRDYEEVYNELVDAFNNLTE
jgi:hypothetical protein